MTVNVVVSTVARASFGLVTVQVPERGVHATDTGPGRVNQRPVDIEERQTTN